MRHSIILFIATILMFSSCDKDLLDTTPYSSVSSNSMWKTTDLAKLGVAGVYSTLRYSNVAYANFNYIDGLGFTNQFFGNESMAPLYGTANANYFMFGDKWKEEYTGVLRANDAIANLPSSPLSDAQKGMYIAECKFLRAYFYYSLNELYQGVPIYTEPTAFDQATKSAATAEEVWQQCINDLTDCINEPNLPNKYAKGNPSYGHVTKGAAYSLRGMVYMWLKEWAKAEADFKQVSAMGYSLFTGKYSDLFTEAQEQCDEMIFSLQHDSQVAGYGSLLQFRIGTRSSYASWDEALPAPDFVDYHQKADGTAFNWDDYLPGYSTMDPNKREVFFLRNGLSETATDKNLKNEYDKAVKRGLDMSLYLTNGNEERLKLAYANRDPRLAANVITPYDRGLISEDSDGDGVADNHTLRFPRINRSAPFFDMWLDRNYGLYCYRKFVYEGFNLIAGRDRAGCDQPLIRFADVQLHLAEVLNEQNKLLEAIDITNTVRTRVGMPALTNGGVGPNAVTGKDDMTERIRYERRIDFPLEGVNLYDEVRWKTWKRMKFYDAGKGNGLKQIWGSIINPFIWQGDYIYIWPIPAVEIQKNSNLKQKPGWD